MSIKDCDFCNNSFCSALPQDLKVEMCSRRKMLKVKRKKSYILDDYQIVVVKSGVILPGFIREDGKEKGLSIKTPGSVLGISQMFSDQDKMFNIYVFADFEGCIFSVAYFEYLFENNAEFAKLVYRKLSENLTIYSELAVDMALSDSYSKVKSLLELINSDPAFAEINLTHDEMAIFLGINRVTVTNVMSEIKKKYAAGERSK